MVLITISWVFGQGPDPSDLRMFHDEEEETSLLPQDHLKCASCQAVAHQFHLGFSKAHKYTSQQMKKDSDLLHVTGWFYPLTIQ